MPYQVCFLGGVCPVIVILVRSFVNSKQVIVVTEHWGVYCRSAPPKQNRSKKKDYGYVI